MRRFWRGVLCGVLTIWSLSACGSAGGDGEAEQARESNPRSNLMRDPLSGVNVDRALGGLDAKGTDGQQPSTEPARQSGPSGGGTPLLNDTLTGLHVQDTIMESEMQADAAARAAEGTAREQLGRVDAAYQERLDEAFDSSP